MVEQSQLLELAKLYGTPLYVYDADQVVANYQSIYKFIAYDKLQVHYALKANYNIALLKALRDAGAGLDTVSPGEIHLALALGFDRNKIIFTANNLKDEEVDEVQSLGVLFNIGSTSRLEKIRQSLPRQPGLCKIQSRCGRWRKCRNSHRRRPRQIRYFNAGCG